MMLRENLLHNYLRSIGYMGNDGFGQSIAFYGKRTLNIMEVKS